MITPNALRAAIGFLDFLYNGSPIRLPGGVENEGTPPLRVEFDSTFNTAWDDLRKVYSLSVGVPSSGSVDPDPDTVAVRGASGELYANNFRAGTTGAATGDQGILTSTNIQLARGSSSTISKAQASSGAGQKLTIVGSQGAAGQQGGEFEFGAGPGGTPETDAPGVTVCQLGATAAFSGLLQVRGGATHGLLFETQYTLSDNSVAFTTLKSILRWSAATSHDLRIGSTTKLTVDTNGCNVPTGATYRVNNVALLSATYANIQTATASAGSALSMNGQKITNLGTPAANSTDAATAAYAFAHGSELRPALSTQTADATATDTGSFQDLGTLEISYTATRTRLIIDLNVYFESDTAGKYAEFIITVDGVTVGTGNITPPDVRVNAIHVRAVAIVAVGSRTVKARWRPETGGGATLSVLAATGTQGAETATLTVIECDAP